MSEKLPDAQTAGCIDRSAGDGTEAALKHDASYPSFSVKELRLWANASLTGEGHTGRLLAIRRWLA